MGRSGMLLKGRWTALRNRLQTSLWVVPFAYTGGAALLAAALLRFDTVSEFDDKAWFLYGGHADGARELLSTIASSMLTIAGLVFSITILVLQLASSQFSPRVLRTFLQDRVTRRAMGTFLGSFVYAMIVLPRVRSGTDETAEFVPAASVFAAFVLVIVSIGIFVQYIHHMAHSIRAVSIIGRVAREAYQSIERLYPEDILQDEDDEVAGIPTREPDQVVLNKGPGRVVISIDEQAMMRAALELDLVIAAVPRVGDFVPRRAPLFHVWGECDPDKLGASDWTALAEERTPHQDAYFGFRQLVDIAERALSPGINDPTTAVQALDHLHDLLRTLCRRSIPSAARVDEDGALRLHLPRPGWGDYVALAFEEIRIYGAGSVQITRKVRHVIVDLLGQCGPSRAAALQEQLALLDSAAARALPGLSR